MSELAKLACAVLEAARERGLRIATAESCTGGLVAGALTDIAGSSDVFERGFVTYSNLSKQEMLNVSATSLERHGGVSEAVALEMARGALLGARDVLAVSVTGIAGPGGSAHKPEGRVCFALAHGEIARARTEDFGALGRAEVRRVAVRCALQMLLDEIPFVVRKN